MPRKPTDLCLLCQKREASKTNSHLVPSFLSTQMFLGSNKKHFLMHNRTKKIFNKPSQSTMKEDYIMCPECEARLGLLERYVSNNLYRKYKDSIHAPLFPRSVEIMPPRREIFNFPNLSSEVLNLFSYSIFWRVANSNEHYPNYNLPSDIKEEIRLQLDSYVSYSWNTLEIQAEGVTLQEHYPFDIFTCLENNQQGINCIIARDYKSDRPSLIAANELHFNFYDTKKVFNPMHQFSSDLGASHVKLVSISDWHTQLNVINQNIFRRLS